MNVLLQGGLGNTMFQWAFCRPLSLRRGLPLSFDRSELDKDQKRKYRLDCYDIDVPIDNTTPRPIYTEKGCPYDSGTETPAGHSKFVRYWNRRSISIRKLFATPLPAHVARRTRQRRTSYHGLTIGVYLYTHAEGTLPRRVWRTSSDVIRPNIIGQR